MIDAYMDQFRAIAALPSNRRQTPLCAMAGRRGHRFEAGRGILFAGRAPNGWKERIQDELLSDESQLRQVVQKELDEACQDPFPLKWVTDFWGSRDRYNTARSAFWRAIRGVDASPDEDWTARIAWSNLYKIAPYAGRNPSARVRRACLPGAARVLELEIEQWRPGGIVILAGLDWARPFLEQLGARVSETPDGLVQGAGEVGGTRLVVARHPQGKPGAQIVREIREALGLD